MSKPDFGPPPPSDFNIYPSKDEIAFFQENGFLVVERITTDEELDWLSKIYDYIFDPAAANLAGAPVDRSGSNATGEESRLSQSFFPEVHFPEILNTTFRRNAKRYTAALLGVDVERLTSWGHMIKKPPGGRSAPWHQDHAYWEPELDYLALGVWLPMTDVTVDMGAMQFIPGSHKRGLVPHRHDDKPEHNLLTTVEPVDLSKAVACPLKKGGATFHHSETLHYTAPNTTDRVRLAFPMEFQVAPRRRAVPEQMPWVDEKRRATGAGAPNLKTFIGDGRMLEIG